MLNGSIKNFEPQTLPRTVLLNLLHSHPQPIRMQGSKQLRLYLQQLILAGCHHQDVIHVMVTTRIRRLIMHTRQGLSHIPLANNRAVVTALWQNLPLIPLSRFSIVDRRHCEGKLWLIIRMQRNCKNNLSNQWPRSPTPQGSWWARAHQAAMPPCLPALH